MNGHVSSDSELYGGDCVQGTRDPLVLPRYRVSSVMVRISDRTRIDEERQTFESGRFRQRR